MKKRIVKKTGNKYTWKLELDKIDWFTLIVLVLLIGFGIFQIVRGVKNV